MSLEASKPTDKGLVVAGSSGKVFLSFLVSLLTQVLATCLFIFFLTDSIVSSGHCRARARTEI